MVLSNERKPGASPSGKKWNVSAGGAEAYPDQAVLSHELRKIPPRTRRRRQHGCAGRAHAHLPPRLNTPPRASALRDPAQPSLTPPFAVRGWNLSQFVEKYGLIWVCLGTAGGDVPLFPEGEAPGFRLVPTGPYQFHAQGPRIIENLLDVAHLPTAHAGLLGDPAQAQIEEYTVTTTAQGIVARDIPIWQPDPDGTRPPSQGSLHLLGRAPIHSPPDKNPSGPEFFDSGKRDSRDEENSLAWIVLAMNYAHDTPEEELRGFQDRVTEQDILIVNSQRPELLPLDLQSELPLALRPDCNRLPEMAAAIGPAVWNVMIRGFIHT